MASNGNVTIRDVYEQVEKLREEISADYVKKARYEPVEKIVYGLVGLIMLAVGSAVVASVVRAGMEAVK